MPNHCFMNNSLNDQFSNITKISSCKINYKSETTLGTNENQCSSKVGKARAAADYVNNTKQASV